MAHINKIKYFNFISIVSKNITVSYTHLDVYKRQAFILETFFADTAAAAVAAAPAAIFAIVDFLSVLFFIISF